MNWGNILFPVDIGKLSKKEKTIHLLLFGFIPIILVSIAFIVIFLFNNDLVTFLYLIPFILLYFGFIPPVIFHDIIVKKEGYFSEYGLRTTYQYAIAIVIFFFPGLFSLGIMIGYAFDNILLGFGISLAFSIPILGEFLRRNVFNDDSCNLDGKVVMGYEPGRFMLLSTIIGLYGYIMGFRSIDSYNTLIWIIAIFAFQFLLLFPDKVNMIFPLEIRTSKGHFAYLGFIFALFLIFVIMCQKILLGTGIPIFSLSFKGLIYWIIGGALAILFVKKYRGMWK